jgi:hypothetical protein
MQRDPYELPGDVLNRRSGWGRRRRIQLKRRNPALGFQLSHAEHGLDAMEEEARRPEVILRALAAQWTAQNPSGIVAEVEREEDVSPGKVGYWFALVVPALDGSRCRLFRIEHGRELYPLRIATGRASDATEVLTLEDFCAALPTIFAAPETVQAMQEVRQRFAEQVPAGKVPAGNTSP